MNEGEQQRIPEEETNKNLAENLVVKKRPPEELQEKLHKNFSESLQRHLDKKPTLFEND